MCCTYCGESKTIVNNELVTGPICKECWGKVAGILQRDSKQLDDFFRNIQALDLWNTLMTVLSYIKECEYKLHFNSVKVDKRLSYPYILHFRALFADKHPLEIDINAVKFQKDYALSVTYKYSDKTVYYYFGKDGRVLSTSKDLIYNSLSWASTEFRD